MPERPGHSLQGQPLPNDDARLVGFARGVAADRVARASCPDQDLLFRVAILEVDNQRLWAELRRLRATLTEAATCLLSFSDRPARGDARPEG